jgi:hypothetical protein
MMTKRFGRRREVYQLCLGPPAVFRASRGEQECEVAEGWALDEKS